MNTDNIGSVFTDYLEELNPKYAILLNGEWGSGKTFFWNRDLSKTAQENGFKTIYISLNGVSKIADLEHLMFLKLIPFVGKKDKSLVKDVTTISKNFINAIGKKYLGTTLSDIVKGVSIESFDFSKHVICFDDLERCQISIKEVLGYINIFVEHRKLKAIILADERKFGEEEKVYNDIKEKTIGRVLYFKADIEKILPNIYKEIFSENSDFLLFLTEKNPFINEIIKRTKLNNIRSILFFLKTLKKVFPFINKVDKTIADEIIFFSILITIEFKSGKIKSSDYNDYKGLSKVKDYYYYQKENGTFGAEEYEKEKYAKMFFINYLQNRISDFHFYPSIYRFILTGYLDDDKLQKEIKKRIPEESEQKIKDFRVLLHYKFRELTDEEFLKLTNRVLKAAKNGDYYLFDYPHIAHFFFFFSNNELIDYSVEEIEKMLFKGLKIVKKKKHIPEKPMGGLNFIKNDRNPELVKINDAVQSIYTEIKKERIAVESKSFVEIIRKGDTTALSEIFDKNKISSDLLIYTDLDDLVNALVTSTNEQIFNFSQHILNRYGAPNIGEFLYDDLAILRKVEKEITAQLGKISKKLKVFTLKELIKSIDEVCDKIETSAK